METVWHELLGSWAWHLQMETLILSSLLLSFPTANFTVEETVSRASFQHESLLDRKKLSKLFLKD